MPFFVPVQGRFGGRTACCESVSSMCEAMGRVGEDTYMYVGRVVEE